jgi:hypothetical protein
MKAVTHNLVLNFLLGLTTQCFATLFSSDIVGKKRIFIIAGISAKSFVDQLSLI